MNQTATASQCKRQQQHKDVLLAQRHGNMQQPLKMKAITDIRIYQNQE